MAKNLIPKIAELLSVELGEEFNVVSKDGSERVCRITYAGLLVSGSSYSKRLLMDIVCGDAEVVKLPWKPKKGELVYTFCYCIGSNDKWAVTWRHWENRVEEIALLKAGWIYRSRAEAERALRDVAVEEGVKREL